MTPLSVNDALLQIFNVEHASSKFFLGLFPTWDTQHKSSHHTGAPGEEKARWEAGASLWRRVVCLSPHGDRGL